MDKVKSSKIERPCIRLVELERVSWLRLYIHPYNLKSRPVVSHTRTASAAE
jgi:hypothetical protein